MPKKVNIIIIYCAACISLSSYAQQQTIKPDISSQNLFQIVNRGISIAVNDNKKPVIHLTNMPGNGVAWINDLKFEKGVLEFDVKGENILQQSFVGIAFHGINDSTYDAVYFRPFNFQSPDTARKKHSVQYISLPKYDWFVLRQTYPAKYENGLTIDIDPEKWFHAKIIVGADSIEVFVNNETKASLKIKPINHYSTGKMGFWVGNNSDGDFSNLSIQNN